MVRADRRCLSLNNSLVKKKKITLVFRLVMSRIPFNYSPTCMITLFVWVIITSDNGECPFLHLLATLTLILVTIIMIFIVETRHNSNSDNSFYFIFLIFIAVPHSFGNHQLVLCNYASVSILLFIHLYYYFFRLHI